MIRELFPLIAALIAAATLYAMREQRRRRVQVAPQFPEITIAEVWRTHGAAAPDHPDRALRRPTNSVAPLPDAALAPPWLLDIDRAAALTEHPRMAVRVAALESVVGALYLEAVAELGAADTSALLRDYTLAWLTLRQYLRLKYDDAVPEDWFHRFAGIARPYIREKVRLTREFALHEDEGAQRFARIYDELLRELQKEALRAPQKKRFVPPDLSHS